MANLGNALMHILCGPKFFRFHVFLPFCGLLSPMPLPEILDPPLKAGDIIIHGNKMNDPKHSLRNFPPKYRRGICHGDKPISVKNYLTLSL